MALKRRGVGLAAPYGHPLVERGLLGGVQLGGAKEIGDLAGQIEGDRQRRRGGILLNGGVVGQEVGDGGEVHGGERAVVAAQGETVTVQDVEHVEDVLGAAYEEEHLGYVHGVARSRIGEQFAELRALERVEAAGGARSLLKDDRVLVPASARTRFCRAVDCWSD
ncbi:hypothetical protein AB0O07_33595 [Streptomyces sp. NPDC093085]|uniref:hypothetical protein n=1 Tax=Streptomyces sp. NPDC093085 TaxID=3155068 RepID=UPI00343F6B5E